MAQVPAGDGRQEPDWSCSTTPTWTVAVNCAVQAAFFSTGQRCTASSRLIVTEGIHDRFVAAHGRADEGAAWSATRCAQDTEIGPVVDAVAAAAGHWTTSTSARREGAKLAFGGELRERWTASRASTCSPRLFTDTHNAMRINREEIFGPVASGDPRASDYEEALAVANDTEFGLSSRHLHHLASSTPRTSSATPQAGMVMVNAADGRRRLRTCPSAGARVPATGLASKVATPPSSTRPSRRATSPPESRSESGSFRFVCLSQQASSIWGPVRTFQGTYCMHFPVPFSVRVFSAAQHRPGGRGVRGHGLSLVPSRAPPQRRRWPPPLLSSNVTATASPFRIFHQAALKEGGTLTV